MATAAVTARTGVEMEAMTAAAVAALTVYDMVKGLERSAAIERGRARRQERRAQRGLETGLSTPDVHEPEWEREVDAAPTGGVWRVQAMTGTPSGSVASAARSAASSNSGSSRSPDR